MKYKNEVMKKILSVLALAVLAFVLFYLNLPVINYGFTGFVIYEIIKVTTFV